MIASAVLDAVCDQHDWTWFCREPAGTEMRPAAWLNADVRITVEAGTVAEAVSRLELLAEGVA